MTTGRLEKHGLHYRQVGCLHNTVTIEIRIWIGREEQQLEGRKSRQVRRHHPPLSGNSVGACYVASVARRYADAGIAVPEVPVITPERSGIRSLFNEFTLCFLYNMVISFLMVMLRLVTTYELNCNQCLSQASTPSQQQCKASQIDIKL